MSKLVTSDNLKAYHAELAEHIKLLQRNTTYALNDIVNYDGITLKCTTAGTTNTTKPNISALAVGSTYTDGTCVWTRIETSAGGGIATYTSGTSYSSGDLVIKDQVLYQANTTTSTTWVESEWDLIGTSFNFTSTYAQKIVTDVVAPYEMLLQVGDSNYCKPPIDVLKKTGGSSNTTLTLENYNNASAYTGTSDFLKIANSKAKLYNYKEYPITPQTLSTIDIGVSDEIDFDDFYSSGGTPDSNTLALFHFDDDVYTEVVSPSQWSAIGNSQLDTTDSKFGAGCLYNSSSSNGGIRCPYDPRFDFGTGDFTIDFWWKQPTSGSVYSGGGGNLYGSTVNGTFLIHYLDSGNTVNFGISYSGYSSGASGFRTTDGEWHHHALVRASGVAYFFLDGELKGSQVDTHSYNSTSSDNVYIFSQNGSNIIMGYFDEFRISNVARWTSDFTPPTEPYARLNYNISSLEVN